MKLHLGCGNKKIDGFINIDLIKNESVDLVEDITKLETFKENSVDLIYACHVLEHIKKDEYKQTLKRWFDLLKPNGLLRLSVPDLKCWFDYYISTNDFRTILGALYGKQDNPYNFHYMGWDEKTLYEDLKQAGFTKIQEYDWRKTEHSNVKDWSRDYLPYFDQNGNILEDEKWYNGKFMNLNVEAYK